MRLENPLNFPVLVSPLIHLDKLRELGLVEKTSQGEYRIVEEVKVGVLRSFVRLYSFMVPIYVFMQFSSPLYLLFF